MGVFPRQKVLPKRAQARASDVGRWAEGMRAGKRLWLLTFLGNVALLFCLLGLPYLRGKQRARAAWDHYDEFARCLYGGGLLRDPALPTKRSYLLANEAAAFASRAHVGGYALAVSCREPLAAVAPPDDFFLLPSLKRAEAALREAVRVARQELDGLRAPLAPGAPLSQRPLRAIIQLRALLEAHSEAADLLALPSASPGAQARITLPTPGRIPLYAGKGAVVSIWGDDAVLHTSAIDRTGVSYVRVLDRLSTVTRLARPSLLRDVVIDDGRLFLVWGMPATRCQQLDCTGKSTGLAEVQLPLTLFPEPRWLAAHIDGRVDRRLLAARGSAVVIAAQASSGVALRSFERPKRADPAQKTSELPPATPWRNSAVSLDAPTLLLGTDQQPTLLGFLHEADALVLTAHTERQAPETSSAQRIGSLTRAGQAWLTACERGDRIGVAYGNESQLVLGELRADGSSTSPPVSLTLAEPVSELDRTLDRVRRFCGPDGSLATVLDRTGTLSTVFCPAGGSACAVRTIADQVESYTTLQTNDTLLFAFAGDAESPQVRTREADFRGQIKGEPNVPSICWTPSAGLCGQPTLSRLGQRIVLAARDGTDLLALESRDEGKTWQPIPGVDPALPRELVSQTQQKNR